MSESKNSPALDADKRALAADLDRVHAELREAATTFPVALLTLRPAENEWCAMELLGHTAELHFSYVARAERLIESDGSPLARDMESPERIEAVATGRTATIDEALARLEEARVQALAFLERLTSDQMAIQGHHQALGPMTVRDVFARTIVGHARNHLNQLRETRRQLEEGGGYHLSGS